MKKKYFTVIAAVLSVIIRAQSGSVGVNTDMPTNTLDVNGTTRIRTLLPNTFDSKTDKIVIADPNGVLKSVSASAISAPSYEILFDLKTLGTAVISDNNPNANSQRVPVVIQNQSITLKKDALVQINFSVPIDEVYKYGTSAAGTDGRTKMLRTHLIVDDTTVIRATNIYSNTSEGSGTGTDAGALAGLFYNTGSYFAKLDAGTHTIRLEGVCNPYITCKQGGNLIGARFQALAIYNQ